ncbi:ankyrin repeat domain-containing protein 65-like [Uloborus diversus]|uniref:ankyrin repeat domain-containing protein 65-like n=1 Tax=Uloborus diversus TaxID=327109 RepID=UPI002409F3E1|nr:ankyrin repeat domain-containing protein 65-like [Uloborus diversus]
MTALHHAARIGDAEKIRTLLEAGWDARARDRSGRTPLHHAVGSGRKAAAEVLLGADPECDGPDFHGRRPLHLAARAGLVPTARALVSRGARLHAKDVLGFCPLHYALANGHSGVARVLLATYAWRGIAIDWEEMELSQEEEERGVRLLSECEAEMREARAEKSRFSLLARRPHCHLARRLSDEAIRRLSDRDLLMQDFPLFGDLLLVRLGEVRERRALEDRFLRCFPLLCPPLPPTCTDVLLACLADDDLRHFARAVEL